MHDVPLTMLRPNPPPRAAAFVSLVARDLAVLRHDWRLFLGRTAMQPLLLLFVFTYVFPKIGQTVNAPGSTVGDFSAMLVGGAVASTMVVQGIQCVALPMVQDFGFTREIEDRVLAPLPLSLIALQKVVSGALQALISGALVFLLALWIPAEDVHFSLQPLHLVLLLPLGAFMSASLGLAVGTRVEPRQVPLVFSLLVVPMTFLGCAYYPWSALSSVPWLQAAVCVNPLVYLSEGTRIALVGDLPHMSAAAVYPALLGLTALLLWRGVVGFRGRVVT